MKYVYLIESLAAPNQRYIGMTSTLMRVFARTMKAVHRTRLNIVLGKW